MKQLFASALFASLLAAGGVAGTSPAQAAPIQSAPALTASQFGAPPVTLVAEGCGPYSHRDRFGNCRPNRPPPPRYCPRFTHPTPYGCRPN